MAMISFKCKCGKEIKIYIKTIDAQRQYINTLQNENKNLKAKVASLETMLANYKSGNIGNILGDLFKGFNNGKK